MNKTEKRLEEFKELYDKVHETMYSMEGQYYSTSDAVKITLELMKMKQKDEIIQELATWEF